MFPCAKLPIEANAWVQGHSPRQFAPDFRYNWTQRVFAPDATVCKRKELPFPAVLVCDHRILSLGNLGRFRASFVQYHGDTLSLQCRIKHKPSKGKSVLQRRASCIAEGLDPTRRHQTEPWSTTRRSAGPSGRGMHFLVDNEYTKVPLIFNVTSLKQTSKGSCYLVPVPFSLNDLTSVLLHLLAVSFIVCWAIPIQVILSN